MNTCVLFGGPNKNGNTAAVLKHVLEGIDGKADIVYLGDKDIHPCRECFNCTKSDNEPNCAINDDMQDVYKKVLDSDCIIIASPIFMWNVTAQTKILLDRFFCMCKSKGSLIKDKKIALVITSGGDEYDGADLAVYGFNRFAKYFGMKNSGYLVVSGASKDVVNNAETIKKSQEFGKKLSLNN